MTGVKPIESRADAPPAAFVQQLVRQAERLARAHGETTLRARRADPRRWRLARLLWPLFSKG